MSEVKVKYYLLFFVNYYFIIESIDTFYFANNFVVYKALLVKEKGGKVVYKIFVVNVVSMHLSATWEFWPFQRPRTKISWGELMDWATMGGGGLAQVREKAQRWGVQKCEDTMYIIWKNNIPKKCASTYFTTGKTEQNWESPIIYIHINLCTFVDLCSYFVACFQTLLLLFFRISLKSSFQEAVTQL